MIYLVDFIEERFYLINKDINVIVKKYSIVSGKKEIFFLIGIWKVIGMFKWSGGFGIRWIGLNVFWGVFGIYGINRLGLIGFEVFYGCIRMLNKDVEELYKYVKLGMIVVIYGGLYGFFENELVILRLGDRGVDVLEV